METESQAWNRKLMETNRREQAAIDSACDTALDNVVDEVFSDTFRYGPGGEGRTDRGFFVVQAPFLKTVINGKVIKE